MCIKSEQTTPLIENYYIYYRHLISFKCLNRIKRCCDYDISCVQHSKDFSKFNQYSHLRLIVNVVI